MRKILLLLGIAIIIIIGYAAVLTINMNKSVDNMNKSVDNSNKYKEIGTSVYYDDINLKSRTLSNNVWGATRTEREEESLKLYIYNRSNGDFGWEWNRSKPGYKYERQYIEPVYPEVVIGTIPGKPSSQSNTPYFPRKYKDIDNWTSEIEFTYPEQPQGHYNLAYDIYWMEGNTKKFNVMIWIQGYHDERPIGTVSDGINEYIHYYRPAGEGQYWEWHAFELKDQKSLEQTNPMHYKVNIKRLLEQLSPESLNGYWTIPGVELGSEIWKGSGRIEVNKYIMNINGNII